MRAIPLLLLAACDAAIGRPTFSQTIPVSPHPVELAAGDLDKDGRVDLVAIDRDGSLAVRLNHGTWVAGKVPAVHAHMIALGDVDADGKLDAVTTDHDSGDVVVLRGDGAGGFAAPVAVRAVTSEKPHNHGLIVEDLDGDGDADAIVADQTAKQLVVLKSNGKMLEASPPIVLPEQPYPLTSGDLDGDGKLDIVVPLVGDRVVAVLRGNGDGTFAAPRTFPTTRERPYGVAIGDLDGDGKQDALVIHDDTNTVVVMKGDGKGGLVESRAIDLPGRIGTGPQLLDVDGDGTLDLVGIGSHRLVVVTHGLAQIRTESATAWRVIAADLDGDGKRELVAPDPERGVVRVYKPNVARRRN
jgi:hypothetical protein